MSNVEHWEHDEQRAMDTEITALREQVEKLTKERDDLRSRRCEVCGYLEHEREHTGCLREQLAALTKERDELKTVPMKYRRMQFNAELQDEVTQLQKQLAVLAEQNEKQRAFLEFAWKDIPMNEYAFKILEHTMNRPNLATPVLNKYRAEGMRMAADSVDSLSVLIPRNHTEIACLLRAKANELENS